MGCHLELCNQEYPQCNGMTDKLMLFLDKITHRAIMEGKQLHTELKSFIMGYCSTLHPSMGMSPSQLLMLRDKQT